METSSFPGPGQSGQHKVSSSGCWDSGLQCSQDTHGKAGKPSDVVWVINGSRNVTHWLVGGFVNIMDCNIWRWAVSLWNNILMAYIHTCCSTSAEAANIRTLTALEQCVRLCLQFCLSVSQHGVNCNWLCGSTGETQWAATITWHCGSCALIQSLVVNQSGIFLYWL